VAAAPVAAVAELVAAAPAAEEVVIPADAAAGQAAAPAAEEVVIPADAAAGQAAAPVAALAELVAAVTAAAEVVVDPVAAAASSPSHAHFVAPAQPRARRRAARPGSIQRLQLTRSSRREAAVLCSPSKLDFVVMRER
jgi:hypothetical protein